MEQRSINTVVIEEGELVGTGDHADSQEPALSTRSWWPQLMKGPKS